MKKLIVLSLTVFSFLAVATSANKADLPAPTCDPCPWVR
jgi:hypothetical protein